MTTVARTPTSTRMLVPLARMRTGAVSMGTCAVAVKDLVFATLCATAANAVELVRCDISTTAAIARRRPAIDAARSSVRRVMKRDGGGESASLSALSIADAGGSDGTGVAFTAA